MDSNLFTDKKTAYDGFVKYRKSIMDAAERGKFDDVFADICTKAYYGDVIAQDVVAYFYSKGLPGDLKLNFDLYMSWEIFSAANGNMFAVEKLEFFLKFGLDAIFEEDDILRQAMRNGNITKDNAIEVISNLLCESIVDLLKIDPKELIKADNTGVPYSNEVNRKYVKALEDSLVPVAEFLMS